jgi:hypothetical protein
MAQALIAANARADAAERDKATLLKAEANLCDERRALQSECAALRAEVERLRTALATNTRHRNQEFEQEETRADTAESESAALRADRDKQEATYRATCAHHDSEVSALRAEVERLQLLLTNADDQETETQEWNAELQSSLAAANAELEQARRELLHWCREVAAANALPSWVRQLHAAGDAELSVRIRETLDAHLAAQPATAPRKLEAWMAERGLHHVGEQPATAPTRTPELDPVVTKMLQLQGMLSRTEAEQAVLDAMARADAEELVALSEGELPDTPLWEVAACKAELARRGLKP